MSQIRKAYSVEIIDKRLRGCETSGITDAMELIGIHDELSRVERKWKEKFAGEHQPANTSSSRRPLANAAMMNDRFARLTLLVEAALRKPVADANEKAFLDRIAADLRTRSPLPIK